MLKYSLISLHVEGPDRLVEGRPWQPDGTITVFLRKILKPMLWVCLFINILAIGLGIFFYFFAGLPMFTWHTIVSIISLIIIACSLRAN